MLVFIAMHNDDTNIYGIISNQNHSYFKSQITNWHFFILHETHFKTILNNK